MARAHTPTSKIVVNKHALTRLALEGPPSVCEIFYRETRATCERVGATGAAFTTPLRGSGATPNIHDVLPWLESIDGTALYAEDRKFLGRLNATLEARCPELKAKLDASKK